MMPHCACSPAKSQDRQLKHKCRSIAKQGLARLFGGQVHSNLSRDYSFQAIVRSPSRSTFSLQTFFNSWLKDERPTHPSEIPGNCWINKFPSEAIWALCPS